MEKTNYIPEIKKLIDYLTNHKELVWKYDKDYPSDDYLFQATITLGNIGILFTCRNGGRCFIHIKDLKLGRSDCYSNQEIPEIDKLCNQLCNLEETQNKVDTSFLQGIMNIIN